MAQELPVKKSQNFLPKKYKKFMEWKSWFSKLAEMDKNGPNTKIFGFLWH